MKKKIESKMKYDRKKIMSRAWEIKKAYDWQAKNFLLTRYNFRQLYPEEKALFSECLKLAWEEAKQAVKLAKKYNVSLFNARIMAAKETELVMESEYGITWNVWRGYSKYRAYYKCASRSKYQNSKNFYFVELLDGEEVDA